MSAQTTSVILLTCSLPYNREKSGKRLIVVNLYFSTSATHVRKNRYEYNAKHIVRSIAICKH